MKALHIILLFSCLTIGYTLEVETTTTFPFSSNHRSMLQALDKVNTPTSQVDDEIATNPSLVYENIVTVVPSFESISNHRPSSSSQSSELSSSPSFTSKILSAMTTSSFIGTETTEQPIDRVD